MLKHSQLWVKLKLIEESLRLSARAGAKTIKRTLTPNLNTVIYLTLTKTKFIIEYISKMHHILITREAGNIAFTYLLNEDSNPSKTGLAYFNHSNMITNIVSNQLISKTPKGKLINKLIKIHDTLQPPLGKRLHRTKRDNGARHVMGIKDDFLNIVTMETSNVKGCADIYLRFNKSNNSLESNVSVFSKPDTWLDLDDDKKYTYLSCFLDTHFNDILKEV